MEDIKFLPDDFELVGDKQDINIDQVAPAKPQWKDILDRFKENKGALIGVTLIIVIVLLAVFVPIFSKWDWAAQDTSIANQSPSSVHFFGTDKYGRDLFVRTWQGTRYSLIIAIVAVIIDVFVGITYGMISGYFGGMVDAVMQRIQEIINSIPTLVVLIILLTIFDPTLWTVIMALIFTEWIPMSRITRAQVLKVKEEEFVLASRTLGASNFFILFKEILPNIVSQLIINSMMTIPNAIFYEAYLSFVGLGLTKPLASLGTLINDGFEQFLTHPHEMIIPAIVMAILMLSFNLFGDGLRDALDPTMKEM